MHVFIVFACTFASVFVLAFGAYYLGLKFDSNSPALIERITKINRVSEIVFYSGVVLDIVVYFAAGPGAILSAVIWIAVIAAMVEMFSRYFRKGLLAQPDQHG